MTFELFDGFLQDVVLVSIGVKYRKEEVAVSLR